MDQLRQHPIRQRGGNDGCSLRERWLPVASWCAPTLAMNVSAVGSRTCTDVLGGPTPLRRTGAWIRGRWRMVALHCARTKDSMKPRIDPVRSLFLKSNQNVINQFRYVEHCVAKQFDSELSKLHRVSQSFRRVVT